MYLEVTQIATILGRDDGSYAWYVQKFFYEYFGKGMSFREN